MATLWFSILALLLALYAVLDGFDLGAGFVYAFVSRNENDRRSVLALLRQQRRFHEIWLLAAGAALYAADRAIFASRGFAIAAIGLVVLLAVRRMSRRSGPAFSVASILAVFCLGAATAFVVASSTPPDWFPALCGISAVAAMTMQSALWISLKTEGELRDRCHRLAARLWWAVLACSVAITVAGFAVHPLVLDKLQISPWIYAAAIVAMAGLIGAYLCLSVGFDLGAFTAVSCLIAGLLISTAAVQVHNAPPLGTSREPVRAIAPAIS